MHSAETMVGTAQELIDISREQGFTFPFAVGNIVRGWCLCAQGEAAKGVDLLLQGITSYRATGAILGVPFFLTTLAEVCGIAGQPQEGLKRLAEG